MNINERIAVMQHYANGGKVEVSQRGLYASDAKWTTVTNPHFCDFNFADKCYRIKKEPRKFTVILRKEDNTIIPNNPSNNTYCNNHPNKYEFIEVTENVQS